MSLRGKEIRIEGLTKRFGSTLAVNDLTFDVRPGVVTGFLGPNGAGKTTTLRCLLGLVKPTSGTATIGGQPYHSLKDPLKTVGAALEAASFHPGRSARDHLLIMADASGIPTARADECLAQVGLDTAATKRVGGFSLGMRQRLGLAGTLLGDPDVLILDEPANGLDPAGIKWLRGFLRTLAAEGRTVVVSSHMLSEVQQTVDEVVVVANGRLVRRGALADLEGPPQVIVRSPDSEHLHAALRAAQMEVVPHPDGAFAVSDQSAAAVGAVAFTAGVELHELREQQSDLEQTFLKLTSEEAAA